MARTQLLCDKRGMLADSFFKFFEWYNYGSSIWNYGSSYGGFSLEYRFEGFIARHDPVTGEIVHKHPYIYIYCDTDLTKTMSIPLYYPKKAFRYDLESLKFFYDSPIDLYLVYNRRDLLICSPVILPFLFEKEPLDTFDKPYTMSLERKWQNLIVEAYRNDVSHSFKLNSLRIVELIDISAKPCFISALIKDYFVFEENGDEFEWIPKKIRDWQLYKLWQESPRISRSYNRKVKYSVDFFDDDTSIFEDICGYIKIDEEPRFGPIYLNEESLPKSIELEDILRPLDASDIIFDSKEKAELWTRFLGFFNLNCDPLNVYEITSNSILFRGMGTEYVVLLFLKTDLSPYSIGLKTLILLKRDRPATVYGINPAMIVSCNLREFIASIEEYYQENEIAADFKFNDFMATCIEMHPHLSIMKVWDYDPKIGRYTESENSNYRKLLRIQELIGLIKAKQNKSSQGNIHG